MAGAGYIVLQVAVMAAILLYCRMIYGFRSQAAVCLKNVALLSAKKDDGGGVENKRLYGRFTTFAAIIGALSIGIAAGKVTMEWIQLTGPAVSGIPVTAMAGEEWLPLVTALGTALASMVVMQSEIWVLKAAGRLTLTESLTDTIVGLKRTYIAAMAMLAAPLIFMYTGANPMRDDVLMYVAIVEAVAISAMFGIHTLYLFIKQKVSLLVWFLYLCTVEIFPISLVVLLVVKNV